LTQAITRRGFLGGVLIAGALTSARTLFGDPARAETLTLVDPNDSNAKALKFVSDGSKIDPHTNPTYKAGERCGDCAHFKGKPTDESGGCEIFIGRAVPASGWCMVWGKR
jgi:hypothetical protein